MTPRRRKAQTKALAACNAHQDKQNLLQKVNHKALSRKNSAKTIVEIVSFKAEVDEMQSFVFKKVNQRWLWHGIDTIQEKS